MNRDFLVQCCDLKNEIEKLEKRIDRIKKQSDLISDVVQKGYKHRLVITGYDYNRNYKLNELNRILKERYDKLLEMQIEIETYINSISKSDVRQIFEHRYIDDMSWIQIQIAMGYNNENTARMKHDRFLEKNL